MKNYVSINGNKIELTDEQIAQIKRSVIASAGKLSDKEIGETCRIGDHEFVVLEHRDGTTAIILKDFLEDSVFSETNCDFKTSVVKTKLQEFEKKIADIIGEDNLIEHTVDLTSNDGLKDYGTVRSKMSLLTADLYRRYVEILDDVNPNEWWWLATPYSTPKHGFEKSVLCVSPSGIIDDDLNCYYSIGVRPFCILNSNIFVS